MKIRTMKIGTFTHTDKQTSWWKWLNHVLSDEILILCYLQLIIFVLESDKGARI